MSERKVHGISFIDGKKRDLSELFGFWRSKESKEALAILNQLERNKEKNLESGETVVSAFVCVPQGYDEQGRSIVLAYDTSSPEQASLLKTHEVALSEALRIGNDQSTAEVVKALKEVASHQDMERSMKKDET